MKSGTVDKHIFCTDVAMQFCSKYMLQISGFKFVRKGLKKIMSNLGFWLKLRGEGFKWVSGAQPVIRSVF